MLRINSDGLNPQQAYIGLAKLTLIKFEIMIIGMPVLNLGMLSFPSTIFPF
jgi:hypothetical protein